MSLPMAEVSDYRILKVPSNLNHAMILIICLFSCALLPACICLSYHLFPCAMNNFCTTFEHLLAIRNLSAANLMSIRQRI